MSASRDIRRRVDVYASTLFEFACAQGTEAQALEALSLVTESLPEVRQTVLALAEMGKGDLLPQVVDAYQKIAEGRTDFNEGEGTIVAKTLAATQDGLHHELNVLDSLVDITAMMTPEVMDMLGVIGTSSDRRLLPSITQHLTQLVSEKGAMALVRVTTAIPLDMHLRDSIRQKMERELDRPVFLVETVDPSIIGGLIISVGDDTRDASVRAQLANMRDTLKTATVGGDDK